MDSTEARDTLARLDARAKHRSIAFAHGRAMRWRIFGDGDPIFLIHGGHGSWLHWVRNIEPLAASHTVFVVDLPGFGDSDDLPHGAGMHEMVEAVSAAIDALAGSGSIGLAGFSFGGAVSARIAVKRGNVRLALVGAAGSGTAQRQATPLIRWRALHADKQESALVHKLVAHMLHDATNADALAVESYIRSIKATRYRSRGAIRRVTLEEVLAPYTEAVLFLWGEHDVTATPEEARARLADDTLGRYVKLVPGGGHWVMFECAQRVNEELARWFGAGPGRSHI
jgi:pimeloyl-ACP methyl ester carboxylesterase